MVNNLKCVATVFACHKDCGILLTLKILLTFSSHIQTFHSRKSISSLKFLIAPTEREMPWKEIIHNLHTTYSIWHFPFNSQFLDPLCVHRSLWPCPSSSPKCIFFFIRTVLPLTWTLLAVEYFKFLRESLQDERQKIEQSDLFLYIFKCFFPLMHIL